jgi:hypothetical protein
MFGSKTWELYQMGVRMSITFNWVHKHENCNLYMLCSRLITCLIYLVSGAILDRTVPILLVIADTKGHIHSHIPFLLKTKRNNSHVL